MSFLFAIVAAVSAVNPPRLRAAVPQDAGTGRVDSMTLGVGSVIAFGVMAVFALLAESLLDWLDVTDEMWRIAAGLIVIVAGLRYVAFPGTGEVPGPSGRLAAIVPVGFPLLVTPELFVLVIALAVGASVATALGAVALAIVAANLVGFLPRLSGSGTWAAGARFHAAVLVVMGVALVVEAIRDV